MPAGRIEAEDTRETRALVAGDPEGTFTPAALPVGHSSEAPGQGVGHSVIHILDIQNITSTVNSTIYESCRHCLAIHGSIVKQKSMACGL
jgi:hypothetical protein